MMASLAKEEAFDMEKERKKEERYMASLALEKEHLELQENEEKAELERVELGIMEKEDKIMSMDISSLFPLQQQYSSICRSLSLLIVCRITFSCFHLIFIGIYFVIQ